jgi:hypothetical protein
MANITEKDIIDHLKEKIKFHENEAKRIEGLLSAFTSDTSTQRGRRAKVEAVNEAIEGEEQQAAPTRKKRNAAGTKKAPATPAKALEVPEKYTDNLTINARIAFALNEIGSGFNEDIAAAMAQYEPKSDAQKISKQISGVLSTLKGKGQLKAVKEGRKDRFSLA